MKLEAKVYLERERRIKLVTRHLKAAIDLLHTVDPDEPPPRTLLDVPVSTSYQDLLDLMLRAARDIIEVLPDSYFESSKVEDVLGLRAILGEFLSDKFNASDTPLEDAEKIVAMIVARRGRADVLRRAELLENVDGRTPEEAEAYRAKAVELRASV